MCVDARKAVLRIVAALLAALCLASPGAADEWDDLAAAELRESLSLQAGVESGLCREEGEDLGAGVTRFYQLRGFRPAWVDRRGLLPHGALVLAALREAESHGLDPSAYRTAWALEPGGVPTAMPATMELGDAAHAVGIDLSLTRSILRYARHLSLGGTVPYVRIYGRKAGLAPCRGLAGELAEVLDAGRLSEFLEGLGPQAPAYRALQQHLERYRKIHRAGGWSVIEDGPALKRGDCGPRVAHIKNRLSADGEDPFASEWLQACFDDRLDGEVRDFQRRHGLDPDGVVGAGTLAALNVPVEERIRQIELNLERRRWMPRDLGSPHLLVNIPGFDLQVVEAGRTARTMRVIVGRKSRPTPVLSSELTYLEVNPYWNVPARIARVDLLPKIQENPSFLVRENFRVFSGWGEGARELDPTGIDWSSIRRGHFPFRLRQEPSAQNALGRVKFMFPNEQSVYLHDTPSKNLFRRSIRTLSSGCVRLEEPLELAAFLLERQDWAPERVSRLAASGRRRVVLLERPVPVHFVYLTSWVDEGGGLHFREDVYGHDRRLALALAQAASAGSSGGTAAQAPRRLVRAAPGGHPPL